ncbi:hypothetical protein QTH97_32685 [Variovorax sp. J22R24]|uniref:hypothetical protein n=1 Tax=Variovorax gracilis TaxID=3053502 RepID=UPI0025776ED4|nr:hypothetical protein [Variovorax sp. J22R24]MDM0109714.1 hypothetical protein [Variovorax sp. J22R24]
MSKIMRQLYEEARLACAATSEPNAQGSAASTSTETISARVSTSDPVSMSRQAYERWVQSLRAHFAKQEDSP